MDALKIKTLYEYLQEGYTVAQLANAIEKQGVTGWDRFNRFSHFEFNGPGASQALDALAAFRAFEDRYFEERELSHRLDPDGPQDLTSALDALELHDTSLERFGWPLGGLPTIDRMVAMPAPPKVRKRRPRDPSDALTALGALLEHLAALRKGGNTMVIPSESSLIDRILEKYSGVKYVKKGTLEDIFADAKLRVREAASQANRGE
jgi:hypothetical protein